MRTVLWLLASIWGWTFIQAEFRVFTDGPYAIAWWFTFVILTIGGAWIALNWDTSA